MRVNVSWFIIFIYLFLLFDRNQAVAESWNFAVFGDTRSTSGGSGVNEDALTAIAVDIVNNRNSEFVLVTGDLVYRGYVIQLALFKTTAENAGLKLVGTTGTGLTYYPVRGNHEKSYDSKGKNWLAQFDTLPEDGPTAASAGGGGLSEVGFTYSLTYDNTLFLAVDQYVNKSHAVNIDWVDQKIASSNSQHIFAFGHEPAYQAGHSSCLASEQVLRDSFLTSLYNAGGRIYFAGHDHLTAFSRVYEKDPDQGGVQRFYQIITGAGGAPLTDFNGVYNKNYPTDYPVTDLYHDSDSNAGIPYHYGYIIVTIDDDLLWLRAYGTESLEPTNWEILHILVVNGTLESDTSALTSDVTNDANLVFNQTADGEYAGVIRGLGNLTKKGSAALTLSGNNTYTGDTTVNEGTLKILGDCSDSSVTVNSAGIFMGTGPIKSLTNFGIVKPGESVGTLDLAGGAFSQGNSGTLEIEVESEISYDKIINVSTATLDGTLKTITFGTYAVGATLSDIIETSEGISGSFSFLDTQITPTLIWKPTINDDDLDLVATRDYNNDVLKSSLAPNEKNVAAAMASVLPTATGDLATVKEEIDNLTTNNAVAHAYSEISPEKLNSLPSFAFNNVGQQINNLRNQIYALRTGLNSSFAHINRTGIFSGDLYYGVLLAYDGDDWGRFVSKEDSSVVKQGGWRLSINGCGSYGDLDSTNDQTGFEYTAGGITIGLSYGLRDNVVIGAHTGYSLSDSDLKGSGGDVDVDTVSYGIYASGWENDFYVNTAVSGSANFYDTKRNIIFGIINRIAEADTFGKQINLLVGSGYDFHFKKLDVGPMLTLQYSKIWIDSFSESGAGALNMHIADQEAESLQSGLGVRAAYDLEYRGKRIVPQIHAFYQHEFLDDSRSIDARLEQGSDIFQVQTEELDRDFMLIGCGLTAKLTETISLNVGYQAQVGRHRYFSHRIDGSIDFYF